MSNDQPLHMPTRHRPPADGWLGTLESPGYRAGNIVTLLKNLPEIDSHHLCLGVLLLDAEGHARDAHSGSCLALARQPALDERSRFVRLVAELLRHASTARRGLSPLSRALGFIRERGVATHELITAAQLLDEACSEHAVTASLQQLLSLSIGEEEAQLTMCDVVAHLAGKPGVARSDQPLPPTGSSRSPPRAKTINKKGLAGQMSYLVRTVGKTHARHFLRDLTDFEMVPRPDMFGV